jgi:TetR/AcrR family transcriptional regulator, transcriptional repressor for nem operon
MARPREFDPDEALDRATQIFWQRGYEATSIQDLVDGLGISRASLYGTFGDKPHLFETVLERYRQQVLDALVRALAPPAAGRAALRAYFSALIEAATQPRSPRGCLLLNTVTGCSTAPGPLLDQALAAVRGNRDRIQAALARDPALAGRSDLPALARFFAAQSHGLGVLARVGVRRQELEEAAEVALRVLDPEPG